MAHTATDRNPFMLMINPEVVLAAVEKSERLSKLNRHLCRPLDRPLGASGSNAVTAGADSDGDEDDEGLLPAATA